MTIDRKWWLGDGAQIFISPPTNDGGGKGGGKGKGGGGDGWTGGGWAKGKKKNTTGLATTGMNYYYANANRAVAAGAPDAVISGYGSGASSATGINLTTGIWTAPQTGWYLVTGSATQNTLTGIEVHIWLQKSTGGAYSTIHTSSFAQGHGIGQFFGHSFSTLVNVNAGDTLRLWQENDDAAEVFWSIASVWTTALFTATKAVASGVVPNYISGYDSKTEYSGNYSDFFDTTTGIFTCPEAGRWCFMQGGRPTTTDPISTNTQLGIHKNGVGWHTNYNQWELGTSMHTHNAMIIYDLALNDTVKLYQTGTSKKNVHFHGFKIPDAAGAWHLRDGDASASGANTTYSGYSHTLYNDGNANATTGIYTTPRAATWVVSGNAVPTANISTQQYLDIRLAGAQKSLALSHPQSAGTSFQTLNPSWVGAVASGSAITLYQSAVQFWVCNFCGFELLGADS